MKLTKTPIEVAIPAAAKKAPAIPVALQEFDNLPDFAYVRQPVVSALYGISNSTVWRYVKAGLLPPPDRLGPNVKGWRVGALRRAQQARAGV